MAHLLQNSPDKQQDFAGNFEKFYAWGQTQGVDFTDQTAVSKAMHVWFGGGSTQDLQDPAKVYTMSMSDRPDGGWLYTDGPFTYNGMLDGLFNQAITGGSALLKWLPVEPMRAKTESVAYLDYILPKGWNGQSYLAFLNSLTVGDCDYGPATAWHGHEAHFGFGEWSVSTETMKKFDFGLPKHQNTPMVTLRGGTGAFSGTIQTDADWAVAQLAVALEQHVEFIMRHGTLGNNLQLDGIANVISNGYVARHIVGSGRPIFSDPLMYDGTSLTTIADILEVIRAMVRKITARASQRNWSIAGNDMAIVMPRSMIPYILDAIACGANTGCSSSNMSFVINDVRSERRLAAAAGLGWGAIEVGNMWVPIIPDDGFGTTYNLSGQNYTTGDIYILTRRVNGVTVLAQQYLNWNMLNLPEGKWWLEQGGITRAGWIDLNEACWYAFAQQAGRFISRMQPLQGVIMSVSVANVLDREMESGFLNDNFFALADADPLPVWSDYTAP